MNAVMQANFNAMLNKTEEEKLSNLKYGVLKESLTEKNQKMFDLFEIKPVYTSRELVKLGIKSPGIALKSLIYYKLIKYQAINSHGGKYHKL